MIYFNNKLLNEIEKQGKLLRKSTAQDTEKMILEVDNLKIYFPVYKGIFRRINGYLKAVDGINLGLKEGEILGVVGESGCGKSTLARALVRLYKPQEGKILLHGSALLDNGTLQKYQVDLSGLDNKYLAFFRSDIQIIFQDPYSSLNPRFTVGDIVSEPIRIHKKLDNIEIKDLVIKLLEKVGLSSEHYYRYPHEFSGGQRQRIGIARALSTNPRLIIADEPVSALDVSVQAQVINLMQDLQDEYNMSYIFIAHDLSVVKHISHRLAVMYLGNIVEIGESDRVYSKPLHPYTKALLSAIPKIEPKARGKKEVLQGDVPSPLNKPSGCPFHPRCPIAKSICKEEVPVLKNMDEKYQVSCHLV